MTVPRTDGGEIPSTSRVLLVLNAVRLGGFADTSAVADRAELGVATAEGTLLDLATHRLIERMSFGGTGGWIITDAGKERLTVLLAEERHTSGAQAVLEAVADRFEDLNTRLVRILTEWQLQSDADRADHREDTLRELVELADALEHLLADLISRLPRFARYPRQFTTAVWNAHAGEDRWVAGVGILSCHTVWAELHQDLLSSLGRARTAEQDPSGR
ncbi:transcriptional regulator [Citricoccus nitrophenolicus]